MYTRQVTFNKVPEKTRPCLTGHPVPPPGQNVPDFDRFESLSGYLVASIIELQLCWKNNVFVFTKKTFQQNYNSKGLCTDFSKLNGILLWFF